MGRFLVKRMTGIASPKNPVFTDSLGSIATTAPTGSKIFPSLLNFMNLFRLHEFDRSKTCGKPWGISVENPDNLVEIFNKYNYSVEKAPLFSTGFPQPQRG
jgi:hypothetical protein